MARLSIFDIFKIGIGPSSSHTMGPWKACGAFVSELTYQPIDRIEVHLYGSLSKTGKGHATDYAILLGLEGFNPRTINPEIIHDRISEIKRTKRLRCNNRYIPFDSERDIIFHQTEDVRHPNTMTLKAFINQEIVREQTYFSVGGGFIEKEGDESAQFTELDLPFPIDRGEDISRYTRENNASVAQIVMRNELAWRSEDSIINEISLIYNTMVSSVFLGCNKHGILPGGLNVKRRAGKICDQLLDGQSINDIIEWERAIAILAPTFDTITKWVSCFALAVNEENASFGKVVTSPTNGAAGVIPAVLLYHHFFNQSKGFEDIKNFLLTAGEIGCLFKKGATISAAVGGCQAEIGVSSSMAAAGLTEVSGGSPSQVLMAAEIAMEHHLGLTCDPVGGLVQIPCIERNSMGAMKAITASKLALSSDPDHALVNLDHVIKTMWETAKDMNHKFKETSEGGLAVHLPVIIPNC